MRKLKGLIEERNRLIEKMEEMTSAAGTEKRAFSQEEENQWEKYSSRIKEIDKEVRELERGKDQFMKAKNGIYLSKNDKMSSMEEYRSAEQYDLGKMIRGIALGDWNGAENEKRAMSTDAVGSTIPKQVAAQIIDLARDKSIFTGSNVPVVPMSTNNLTVTKLITDPVFKFKAENVAASESSLTFDSVDLKAKTILGYAYISIEAIRSSANLSSIVLDSFAKALSSGIDTAMLYGQGAKGSKDTFAPSGIMNDTGILTLAHEGQIYDTFIKAKGKVRRKNYNPTHIAINAGTEELIGLLKDSDGRYINTPEALADMNMLVSNQLIEDDVDGSDAIVFDPTAMIVGIQDSMHLKMLDSTDKCIQNGQVAFAIYAMVDCVVVKPNAICKVTGIK